MLARLLATVLLTALLLPVGQQVWLYGQFALNNAAFTQAHCRNWEAEAPMCFGSCKITDTFVNAAPSIERLTPSTTALQLPQYCQAFIRAGAQVQCNRVTAEWGPNRPVGYVGGHGRVYIHSVFWPPAV